MISILIFFVTSTCFLPRGNTQDFLLSDVEKQYLLNLSRQTLCYYIKDKTKPEPNESALTVNLKMNRDCFVTLYKKEYGLRGCIGFGGRKPLYMSVIDRTIAAATEDTRFEKVQYSELKEIKLEISVLTEREEIQFSSPDDLLNKIQSGVDGILLYTRYGGSTYIPKVWESIPDKKKFLSTLCMKHGAPPNIWVTDYKNIRVLKYQAICFGEEIYGRRVIGKKGALVGKMGAYILGAVDPVQKGLIYGGYKLKEGTELAPGSIVSPNSDIIED